MKRPIDTFKGGEPRRHGGQVRCENDDRGEKGRKVSSALGDQDCHCSVKTNSGAKAAIEAGKKPRGNVRRICHLKREKELAKVGETRIPTPCRSDKKSMQRGRAHKQKKEARAGKGKNTFHWA